MTYFFCEMPRSCRGFLFLSWFCLRFDGLRTSTPSRSGCRVFLRSMRHATRGVQISDRSDLLTPARMSTQFPLFAYSKDSPEYEEQASKEAHEDLDKKKINRGYIVLSVLVGAFACNQWSRQALYYLCDFSPASDPYRHVNAALGFSKDQYASLASFGFTLVFAFVSLFAGGVSDTVNRKYVTAVSCAAWSILTGLHAFARNYYDLIPLRALVGASQAFYNPAAYTLLADLFPKKMLGSVNGIYSGGIYFGGALASLSILLDEKTGWRNTMMAIGAIGVLASLVCLFLVPEPRNDLLLISSNAESELLTDHRKGLRNIEMDILSADSDATSSTNGNDDESYITALSEVFETSQAKLLFLASALRFCGGFSLVIWKAPFIFAKFPGSESVFAGTNAAVVAVGGLLSSVLGGYLSDWLANPKSDAVKPRARSLVPAVGSFIAAPFWAGFILSSTPSIAALCLFGEYIAAECWFGPTLASLFDVVPSTRRGVAQGIFSVLTAVGNVGPVVVGALVGGIGGGGSDGVGGADGSGAFFSLSLGDALLVVVCGCYVLSGVLFALVAKGEQEAIDVSWKPK